MHLPSILSRPYSLRARLLAFLLVPFLALLGISIITDYQEGLRIANEAYDQTLHSTALALSGIIDHDPTDASFDLPTQAKAVLRFDAVDQLYYAIFDSNNALLAGDARMSSLIEEFDPDDDNPDFRFDVFNEQNVRVATYRHTPSTHAPHGAVIIVAETTHKREAAASRIMTITLLSDLFFMVISMLVIFVGMHYAHRPLAHIGQKIDVREPDDLSPIDESAVPSEIQPLIRAMNRLMSNLREASIAQQNFISSAAHQLRSPLAALQAQIDVATEGQQDETLRRLHDMQVSVIRLSRLTKQMLALARAAPDASRNVELTNVALEDLIENAASEFVDQAVLAGVDLGFELAPAPVWGEAWSLREMLANLIDNAVRYSGSGCIVTVRCGTEESGNAWLEVEDNGSGIPEAMHEKAFARFVRLDDTQGGSGLGLAIVKEVAQLHHARVNLHSAMEGQGLRVRVAFPPSGTFPLPS
ncbi:MAG: sensor histidine kinase N-terminal domain-containing protein [Betaproteobacteria bacterium]|nr:sensor histidine kinase N-terminal domain-containing protein [Betaproteobacteria bacterium]